MCRLRGAVLESVITPFSEVEEAAMDVGGLTACKLALDLDLGLDKPGNEINVASAPLLTIASANGVTPFTRG